MNFSRLKKAGDYEVEQWIADNIEMTAYSRQTFRDKELVRFSPFVFYKERGIKKHNHLWRLTAPLYLIYCLLIITLMPLKWLITGNRYLPQKFLENFHYRWEERMGW